MNAIGKIGTLAAPAVSCGFRRHRRLEDVLDPRNPAAPSWAAFDAAWYAAAHKAAADAVPDGDPEALLGYYIVSGQAQGHSPNIFFDEVWYLAGYPEIKLLVDAGHFRSGFDHYCEIGFQDRAPHWLFDDHAYRSLHADLSDEAITAQGCANRYDHYLRYGSTEGRRAHIFLDPQFYRARLPARAQDSMDRAGAFTHFLRGMWVGAEEVQASAYFDPAWYRETYADVADALAARRWLSALHHYICNDSSAPRDPSCHFSERHYRDANADVAAAIAARRIRSGYEHFLWHGVFELRAPAPFIDLRGYWDSSEAARREVSGGTVRDAFAHFLANRRPAGPAPDEAIAESAGRALFDLKARLFAASLAGRTLDFTPVGPPALSVIMVLHDSFARTILALGSLRGACAADLDLILVDSGSHDETTRIAAYVTGARILRHDKNIGYLRGCNAALPHVRAHSLLYLNNDIELLPGSVDAALARLASAADIGAVGGMVIRTHGKLQEAGCIVWRNGDTSGYLRDEAAEAPEANFVRDVDFCSGAFLLARTGAVRALGGFDEAFAPAYYEDADLCARLWQLGWRVVYDPAVRLLHYEYGSARDDHAALALMQRHRETFMRRHRVWLRTREAPEPRAALHARQRKPARGRILFIEDTVPLRATGSGYVRANAIVRGMAALGFEVSVFPVNGCAFPPARLRADMPEGTEILHNRTIHDLAALLRERAGFYDHIWISRAHNLDKLLAVIGEAQTGPAHAHCILDTECVFALRAQAKAALNGAVPDMSDALEQEFANAWFCQHVVAVSAAEATLLHDSGLGDVRVLGTAVPRTPTPRLRRFRAGMLFVGAMHSEDSPNFDSLCWFAESVLPLLEPELGEAAHLTIAGYTADAVDLARFRAHPRITIAGAVDDLTLLYDSHILFVAPTRYGAGTPYKVYEAAAHGLPVVATELLAAQLGWRNGTDILAASHDDPAGFARHICRIWHDGRLWRGLRNNALERIRHENAPENFLKALGGILANYPSRASPSCARSASASR